MSKAYVYEGELYCSDCADGIREELDVPPSDPSAPKEWVVGDGPPMAVLECSACEEKVSAPSRKTSTPAYAKANRHPAKSKATKPPAPAGRILRSVGQLRLPPGSKLTGALVLLLLARGSLACGGSAPPALVCDVPVDEVLPNAGAGGGTYHYPGVCDDLQVGDECSYVEPKGAGVPAVVTGKCAEVSP